MHAEQELYPLSYKPLFHYLKNGTNILPAYQTCKATFPERSCYVSTPALSGSTSGIASQRTRSPYPGDTAQREEVCPEAAAKRSSSTSLSPPGWPCLESSETKTGKDSQALDRPLRTSLTHHILKSCSLCPSNCSFRNSPG